MSVALWISWKAPVTCWRVREHFWMFRWVSGGLEKKIEVSGDLLAEWSQVFVVEVSDCGEREG